jgi:beta-glucosidase/6-phospho-beta-glucosidase/beta-galactosidase
MKLFSIVAAFVALFFAAVPVAEAGNISFNEGRGAWQSTRCQKPAAPSAMNVDPETYANDLNARMAMHNQFVAQAEAYANCVSEEAAQDASAVGAMISGSAQKAIEQMQGEVAASANAMYSRFGAQQ